MSLETNISTSHGAQLPNVVYSNVSTGNLATSEAYATVFTIATAGLYRVAGCLYPTVFSSTSCTAEVALNVTQNGSAGSQAYVLENTSIASPISSPATDNALLVMAVGAVIQIGTFKTTGTNTGATFSYGVIIEQVA